MNNVNSEQVELNHFMNPRNFLAREIEDLAVHNILHGFYFNENFNNVDDDDLEDSVSNSDSDY